MYTRPPSREEPKIKIPENYGGSMFKSNSDFYPAYSQNKNISSERTPSDKNSSQYYSKERQQSDIKNNYANTQSVHHAHPVYQTQPTYQAQPEEEIPPVYDEPDDESAESVSEETEQINETKAEVVEDNSQPAVSLLPTSNDKCDKCDRKGSLFSSILPSGALKNNFPFGHGIGSEELLIMGIMLMVFMSGNNDKDPDGELMLLLAMLLFAG